AMLLQPSGHLPQAARRREADGTTAPVECEPVLGQCLQDPPRLAVTLRRGLEVQPHINHGPGAVGADDLAGGVIQLRLGLPGALVAVLILPVLERLPAAEAGEVIAVVVPGIATH